MANIFNQVDRKIANAKVNQAMEMLKNKSPEEIKKKLGNVKREDLIKQLNQIDAKKVKSLNIDTEKIKKSLTQSDIEKIKVIAGKDSDLVMAKLNEILNSK